LESFEKNKLTTDTPGLKTIQIKGLDYHFKRRGSRGVTVILLCQWFSVRLLSC